VNVAILLDEVGAGDTRDLPDRVIQGLGGNGGVDPGQGRSEPLRQHHITEAGPFRYRLLRGNLVSMAGGVSQAHEPLQGRFLDDRLGEPPAHVVILFTARSSDSSLDHVLRVFDPNFAGQQLGQERIAKESQRP
jgi:hypothetical protein